MPDNDNTPRLDAIEAQLADQTAALKDLQATVASIIPDERDVPKEDGLTDRERWFKMCQDVVDQAAAKGETITLDDANDLLLLLPEFANG